MVRLSPGTIAKGLGVYFAAAVSGYLYLRSTKAPAPSPCGCGGKHGLQAGKVGASGNASKEAAAEERSGQDTFDRIADFYDSCINLDEMFMGIKLMRHWLIRQAEGDVLEVSAGTGRNLPYYNLDHLHSLTLTDTSRHMLVNAVDKHAALGGRGDKHAALVRFALADAQHLTACTGGNDGSSSSSDGEGAGTTMPPQQQGQQREQQWQPAAAAAAAPHRPPLMDQQTFPPASFDVVVDTFGLCSQQDPVTALKEMARVCKPEGHILLLQHGTGTWSFVNKVLDNGAGEHFRRWGCWWNRDIERIMRQAGLQVESMSRWHFGTTYLVVARPGRTEAMA